MKSKLTLQDPCYIAASGGFIQNQLRKECPHDYNISDINEQWSEIPQTDPGNDGPDFVQTAVSIAKCSYGHFDK